MAGTPERRASVVVTGRVQGVFFRAAAREQAERLGLAGWIRNLRDGRVEALVEGSRGAVEAFVRWCHDGPPHARVDDVQTRTEPPTGEFDGFTVVG